MNNNGNILLNKIVVDNSLYSFKEIIPYYEHNEKSQALIINKDNNILWSPIDLSLNIIVNNKFRETDIYYDNGRIGLSRFPLFTYKIDVAVPKDTLMTAFHVGDGSFGFSMGNGTNKGFIPEIIGIGSSETDAGLYFVGIAGNNVSSDIPLISIDGRNTFGKKLVNRPIFGVTSGDYMNYVLLLDQEGNLNVQENIVAKNIILNNESLLQIIQDLQKQINELKAKTKWK